MENLEKTVIPVISTVLFLGACAASMAASLAARKASKAEQRYWDARTDSETVPAPQGASAE